LAPAPTLSICIPTHHGRAGTLDDALASVREQQIDGIGELVEVCVSDNASADGTDDVIARHVAEAPFAIRHLRNARDLGGSRNLMQAVGMAAGRWRWLLSSDDALLPDGLRHVLWLAERNPDAAGLSFAARWFDREMRTAYDLPTGGVAVSPEAVHGRVEDFKEILRRFGQCWSFMSAHVVRADAWEAGVAEFPSGLVERTIFPHVAAFARGARHNPRWAWSSGAVVAARTDNHWYGRIGEVDHAALVARMARDYDGIWRTAVDSRFRRVLAEDWLGSNADREQIRGVREMGATPRGRARLALALARRMWFSPRLWRETLPALAAPQRRRAERVPGPPSRPLPETAMQADVAVDAPERWFAGGAARLSCHLENRGASGFPISEPHPVRLGARWIDLTTGDVAGSSRAELPRPLRPGESVPLDLAVVAPPRPGRYALRIAPVQEHLAWFDDVNSASGQATEALVELPLVGSPSPVAT
jgi:glycosyltransferase involved in cell wall biosynthesis